MSEKELLKDLEGIIAKAKFPDDAASIVLAFFRKNLKSLVEIDEKRAIDLLVKNAKLWAKMPIATPFNHQGIGEFLAHAIVRENPVKLKEE